MNESQRGFYEELEKIAAIPGFRRVPKLIHGQKARPSAATLHRVIREYPKDFIRKEMLPALEKDYRAGSVGKADYAVSRNAILKTLKMKG